MRDPFAGLARVATWQKNNPDDTWVLRVVDLVYGLPPVSPGDVIAVRKASGEMTRETVSEIIWKSGALAVCRHVPKAWDDDED